MQEGRKGWREEGVEGERYKRLLSVNRLLNGCRILDVTFCSTWRG